MNKWKNCLHDGKFKSLERIIKKLSPVPSYILNTRLPFPYSSRCLVWLVQANEEMCKKGLSKKENKNNGLGKVSAASRCPNPQLSVKARIQRNIGPYKIQHTICSFYDTRIPQMSNPTNLIISPRAISNPSAAFTLKTTLSSHPLLQANEIEVYLYLLCVSTCLSVSMSQNQETRPDQFVVSGKKIIFIPRHDQ